jgi:nucleoside-diphosphate-sugar epimerase
MRLVVLGAGGFIGSRLAAQVAAQGHWGGRAVDEIVLFDQRPVRMASRTVCKVSQVHGDLRDAHALDELFAAPVNTLVHLAATLTLDAENDFRHGLETNLLSLVELLERCRLQPSAPVLLFASSISTFGGVLPDVVGDSLVQAPDTSYGTHKAIAEHLLVDYSRHGFVDGRALRLPVVLTHPGPASGSISDQVSSLIREPLRGQRTTCRLTPDTPVVVASVDNVVRSFMHLASLPEEALCGGRIMNLPGLTVTPMQIVQAVARHAPQVGTAFVDWHPDAGLQRIVDSWPRIFTSQRALALGLQPDASVDAVVKAFLASEVPNK